jgi:hypothetical protein
MRTPHVDAKNDLVCRDPNTPRPGSSLSQGVRVRSTCGVSGCPDGPPNSSSARLRQTPRAAVGRAGTTARRAVIKSSWRMVGNPDQGRADSGEAVFLCIVGARHELPLVPRTARLARHGVAAHGVLRPTSDGDLHRAGRTGSTQAQPRAASFDRITLSNEGSQGERAPSRRSGRPGGRSAWPRRPHRTDVMAV